MNYSEEECIDRFRLKKECVLELLNEIGEHLEPKQTKVSSISPLNQLLIALWFYGTGCWNPKGFYSGSSGCDRMYPYPNTITWRWHGRAVSKQERIFLHQCASNQWWQMWLQDGREVRTTDGCSSIVVYVQVAKRVTIIGSCNTDPSNCSDINRSL